jgi:hypothetical protein
MMRSVCYLHPDFGTLYTQACEKRVEAMENDLLEIADDTDRDTGKGRTARRSRTREWCCARRSGLRAGNG